MPEANALPPKLIEQLYEDHGRNPQLWPSELRDLVDPTISAKQRNAPVSGMIEEIKNHEFAYYWAKDVCGQNPDHTRVEELRYDGWDYATTRDVKMCTDDTVRNRDKQGFSNEIRSGDRRLMKCSKIKWRENRKAENVRALMMAYPQGFGSDGSPMSTKNLTPGVKTYMGSEVDLDELARKRVVSSAANDIERAERGERPFGNTSIHKPSKD